MLKIIANFVVTVNELMLYSLAQFS